MFPESEQLGEKFHNLFIPSYDSNSLEWKRKRNPKLREKRNLKNAILSHPVPKIELPANPSAFAVFATVRLAILEEWTRNASRDYFLNSCGLDYAHCEEFDSDTDENSQNTTYLPLRVSKMVGLGLRSVFELIRESRDTHPVLCTKALFALLDILQGQTPEGLKSEPPDVTDSLFQLLLELATCQAPEITSPNDGNHFTAVACACLLSLIVVRGDTGRYLTAITALLMSPNTLPGQHIRMPAVLVALQRSIHGVLIGKLVRPEWFTHGLPASSKIDVFTVSMPPDIRNSILSVKSLTSDGQYLYLFTNHGLFKVGTGFGGSAKGCIYAWKTDFYPNEKGWVGFCNNKLYLKIGLRRGTEVLSVERNGFHIMSALSLDAKDLNASVIFADGENLGTIMPTKDDGFVVRTLNPNVSPAACLNELPLKLARKCMDILGSASFEEDVHMISPDNEEGEVTSICAGKDFALFRSTTGKVFYCGKPSALGYKQAGTRTSKWTELSLTNSPEVVHVAVGHDGLHAICLTEDGCVFFVGTARRGEDGDQIKTRRQPKPVKPKIMLKVEGQFIVHAACNNGSTALVTKDGELLMFGKDTTHADSGCGVVSGLNGEFITQVALGKAHAVALNNKGHVFTFGINNKFQCGREQAVVIGRDPINIQHDGSSAMETGGIGDELDGDEGDPLAEVDTEGDVMSGGEDAGISGGRNFGVFQICRSGRHTWRNKLCMVCTICSECTGYSSSCLSSIRPGRFRGQECGCGEGDSGCAICGCCRNCAQELVDNSGVRILQPSAPVDIGVKDNSGNRHSFNLQQILDERGIRPTKLSYEYLKLQLELKQSLKNSSPYSLPVKSNIKSGTSSKDSASDADRDQTRVVCFPPARLYLPIDSPVIQVACGLHHTVLLTQNGQVFTFGSNQYGQLGCGDILAQSGIQRVKLPSSAASVAAGSNHTVILTTKGEVYTFGNHQKGQLGREAPQNSGGSLDSSSITTSEAGPSQSSSTSVRFNHRSPWYCIPASIPNVGPRYGRRATWIGASGDQTFIKIDESLIHSLNLAKSTIIANKINILILPNQADRSSTFKCLAINRNNGSCNSFNGSEQINLSNQAACLDPLYNVIWSYNPINHEIGCYNIIASEVQSGGLIISTQNKLLIGVKTISTGEQLNGCSLTNNFNLKFILTPELALPVISNCFVTRLQTAIHLLCCLDTLTTAHEFKLIPAKEEIDERQIINGKSYSRDDFQTVNRFESHGGGWGYSGHSIEAIRFMADTEILLGGYGLFGGRGEYVAKIKLFDIGLDGGEQECDGELIAETEDIPYECGPRQKFPILFDEPISLQAHRWYVAWCRINGPSSDCGSSGQGMVTTEDQVLFYFKSSKKSNNGTDVNAGQIPQLLYRVITPVLQTTNGQMDTAEPVYVLSRDFSCTVTKECFQALLSLLRWSWNTFKFNLVESHLAHHSSSEFELEKLVYISRASLRLIRVYIMEIYPEQTYVKVPLESAHLAESIGDVRNVLIQILANNLSNIFKRNISNLQCDNVQHFEMINGILNECQHTFVVCFHAFYPTAFLKWSCLCNLLDKLDKENGISNERLLSAVLSALCGPLMRLRNIFPILSETNIVNDRGNSPSDNIAYNSLSTDAHYPILVQQMNDRTQIENDGVTLTWTWREVLDRLLSIVTTPVVQLLTGKPNDVLPSLTHNCCLLLARVIAELVQQCSASDEDLPGTCGRVLHMTPSRFTRINQTRTWNTGNGSPDAICFQVDRPGISIAGAAIYGGLGDYDYELDILEDLSSMNGLEDRAHKQRWNGLETIRGSVTPDDYNADVLEIKFERVVPIKENVKYAFRLSNNGGRTCNGDGGVNIVNGPDGTTFMFSNCSLSYNGTTQLRGQIPHILYYSNPQDSDNEKPTRVIAELQARKCTLSMTSTIIQRCSILFGLARENADDLEDSSFTDILSNSCVVTTLLPLVLAHIGPLVTSDPRSGVQITTLIQDILPHVAALNLMSSTLGTPLENQEFFDGSMNTTSPHYTWVESDHPYKLATVSNYRVAFPNSVKWISLEFDPACGTAQPEDCLQIYVPNKELIYQLHGQNGSGASTVTSEDLNQKPMPYWPVLQKFTAGSQWPQTTVVLPGNEVIFSLETASDYLKDEHANTYGFRCLVVGYEWPMPKANGLRHLEAELAFLGGMCAASLMKKDLQLSPLGKNPDPEDEIAEIVAQQRFVAHESLLSRGLSLSTPSVTQSLDGVLNNSSLSYEQLFLRDFVDCVEGSSGGRLAQWLQPTSRVDPAKCEVLYNRDELRCGWPSVMTVLTRDQYGDLVQAFNLYVDVKAIPIDKKDLGDFDVGRKMRRFSQTDPFTFGGLPPPPSNIKYESTIRDKMCFHTISLMKPYQNYSFEEIRFAAPPVLRSSEHMLVRPNDDGTYTASWTPASVGCYSVLVTIDGYAMEKVYKVEVREPPQGMMPPSQNPMTKPTHQPSKLRKFVTNDSAGLRIRAHPSLQSEQIGIVHVNGTIAFIDEIHNDDGVWLRLSQDTIKQYCSSSVIEAWCLQYNQHLGKTFLLPVEEPRSILDELIIDTVKKSNTVRNRAHAPIKVDNFYVINCGASGHNIRSKPSLKAPPVGILGMRNQIGVTEYIVNSDGCWVLLDQASRDKYCFTKTDKAWSLAIGNNNTLYLGNPFDAENVFKLRCQGQSSLENITTKRGYDFSMSVPKNQETPFTFGTNVESTPSPALNLPSSSATSTSTTTNPFVFGEAERPEPPKIARKDKPKDAKLNAIAKWLKGEDSKSDKELHRDTPSELSGVSVKELVKALGESRTNGNGATPPETPKRSRSPRSPKPHTRSSSPIPISAMARVAVSQSTIGTGSCVTTSVVTGGRSTVSLPQDSTSSNPQAYGSSRSMALSSLISEAIEVRRASTQSDTSALLSSLTRDLSQSPSLSPSYEQSLDHEHSPRKLMQTGTQTSPENSSTSSVCSHFSIGTSSKDDRIPAKTSRRDRSLGSGKPRPKRAISPANIQQMPSTSKLTLPTNEPVKQAMTPSVAESLRAVFAAFLWHEGIVHDAMACASFLKFHPKLPKKGALVITRHPSESPVDKRQSELSKEERIKQRHSLEVTTAGNYLQIQPSTLETLTRSAANANANRNRSKKISGVIKEDIATDKFTSDSYNTITVLPPALKSIVYLWEELTSYCLSVIMQPIAIPSPVQGKGKKHDKNICSKNDSKDNREKNLPLEKENKRSSRKKKEWKPITRASILEESIPSLNDGIVSICELCGGAFPHPITHHMRAVHPGCGKHSGGKGYNSSGYYCFGWSGNCGEGGSYGSSWYLLCETCKEKYINESQSSSKNHEAFRNKTSKKKPSIIITTLKPTLSPGTGSFIEPHKMMKNNAMFLLELASSNVDTSPTRRTSSNSSSMHSLTENQSPSDSEGPFGPSPPFQCLRMLGASMPYNESTFYEEVLRKQNHDNNSDSTCSVQRPLSEVSFSDPETNNTRKSRFHRSVSMGTNGLPWARAGQDGRIVMMRKRNLSNSERNNEAGSLLLCNPSPTLQKLIPKMSDSAIVSQSSDLHHNDKFTDSHDSLSLLQRPVLSFVMQYHDLDALRISMKQALRKATCRVYAMQALNWFLRSVTQPMCLHDLLWWFVISLTPLETDSDLDDDNKSAKKTDDQDLNVSEHPLSDIILAGDAVHPLTATFHTLLQTIADLMVLLPMGSPLQQMAVRCWGLRFTQADHSFLHRSHVFSNISKILSRSEELENCYSSMHESHHSSMSQITAVVECFKDLTPFVDIKASSRQAMVSSLIDGSTETFWQSGDEDRSKTKVLTVTCLPEHRPKMVCLHIDNCRDIGNKVTTVLFYSGPNSDELIKLRIMDVENRLLGSWINCPILDYNHSVIRLELKGPDSSLRVRHIRILGELLNESLQMPNICNAMMIQQQNCETETLRVFRLITSQVFGKLILGDQENQNLNNLEKNETADPLEESNDLKEHMVGILFSRSKLTHLQKQVIIHIVQTIRKETMRVKEEWEAVVNSNEKNENLNIDSKITDVYCFEMLSMVLALSGSSVGRAYLSHQYLLLSDLLSLLHTGSARVQRQVTSLFKRMLPEISPESLAKVMNINHLPPADFSIISVSNKDSNSANEFDIHRTAILDVFLSIIAKSLSVQVKVKSKDGTSNSSLKTLSTITLASTIQSQEYVGDRWWLRGTVSRNLSEVIIQLLKDMAAGKLSEAWANVTKGAVAENILNLTRLSENHRNPSMCLNTPTLWLALASLCVLDREHVEQLSSGQWNKPDGQTNTPRPVCSNHDDGETSAIIQCNECGNLCTDCDRVLHLNRKTRMHIRQVCKEEEEAIKVELHEGCGRTKLFWLLALADARTLKALVEFREGGTRTHITGASGTCRFCGTTGNSGLLAIGNVCADHECQEYARTACIKIHNCGHMCGGVQGESSCLPCLHGCAVDVLRQDADDMCMICFTEALSCAPSIQLKCGHVFHLHCCRTVLLGGWVGPRITFSFSLCPICKADIEHPVLTKLLAPIQDLYNDVKRKALMRLEYEGLHSSDAITSVGSRFYNDPAGYAMDRYAYYVCYKCSKAYYGGEARCDAEVGENYDPTELVCGACSDVARAQMCPKHGTDFLEYKCRYCCSVAVFFCFGTTHFCNSCHDDFQRVTNLSRSDLPSCPAGPKATQLDGEECPLHVKHPPTGEEFALGCGVCRNAHTF